MADDDKKFRHPAGVAIRKGLDAKRYRRSAEGKAEKEARKAHNERFYPDVDRKTKRALKKAAKDSDAAKGAAIRKMQSGGMAGASPAEIRDQKQRQRKENRKTASQRRDGQKAAKPLNIEKTPGNPASSAEQARNLGRVAEIDKLRREEAKKRQERARASRATVGMGPAKVTTGGGLGTMTQRDRSKPKLLKDGGAVCRGGRSAQRGTQFRGVR